MIPLWILTILHYASLTAAVLILLLLARQAASSRMRESANAQHSESQNDVG